MAALRNAEVDKILEVETSVDSHQDQIRALEKELARKTDEVEIRKEVIESMSASMMRHEKENRELVSKLVLLKNQILEYDIAAASENLTFGAVKIVHSGGFIKAQPVPVSVRKILVNFE